MKNKKLLNFIILIFALTYISCEKSNTMTDPVIRVTGIVISHSRLDLEPGGQQQIKATVLPDNATNQNIEWTFSNPDLVTMDLNGVITALVRGEITITVQSEDGGFKAECDIYISNKISEFSFQILQIEEEANIEIIDYIGSSNSVYIPRSINDIPVTIMGINSFHNKSLAGVNIPEGVILIREGAFSNNLFSSLVLPNSLITIEPSAFSNNQLSNLSIGENVSFIGRYAFEWNNLSRVTIPNSVASIGTYSLANNQLTEVVFGDSVTIILWGAFANNQLTNIELPHSLRSILGWGFGNNQITRVSIGDGVQIGPYIISGVGPYIISGDFSEVYDGIGGIFTRETSESEKWERQD